MDDFVNKPEDYDAIVHGETRFVIFEKREEISIGFYFRMRYYWRITRKIIFSLLESVIIHKQKLDS
jgi:hypothetical protein